jgi:hypothetical protein
VGLVGLTFYQQAIVPDPLGATAFVMSDAISAIIGP